MQEPRTRYPRSHLAMCACALASFFAWLGASGQDYKTLVLLFTFLLAVIAVITCFSQVLGFKPTRSAIIVAAAMSLGSCLGQCHLNMEDRQQVLAEMHGLTCSEGAKIRSTGRGLGRSWTGRGHNRWRGKAPGPLRYWDLYLSFDADSHRYYMGPGGMGDDLGSAMTFCGPGSTSTLPDVATGPRG